MNNKKKNDPKTSAIAVGVAVLIVMLGAAGDGNWVLPVAFIAVGLVIAGIAAAQKKKKTEDKTLKRMSDHEVNTPAFTSRNEPDEEVRCTCARGKQRYLDQAAMFYKNGLIDRAEYTYICDRYSKLDIPEDF